MTRQPITLEQRIAELQRDYPGDIIEVEKDPDAIGLYAQYNGTPAEVREYLVTVIHDEILDDLHRRYRQSYMWTEKEIPENERDYYRRPFRFILTVVPLPKDGQQINIESEEPINDSDDD